MTFLGPKTKPTFLKFLILFFVSLSKINVFYALPFFINFENQDLSEKFFKFQYFAMIFN